MAVPALEPIYTYPPYSIVVLNILLFVDEVLYLYEQMVWIVEYPCGYCGITHREKARGIKKTRGWG